MEKALEVDPNYESALILLDNIKKGIKGLKELQSKSEGKTASELCDMGFELARSGFFLKAIELFKKVVKMEPKHEKGYYYLAAAYEKVHNYHSAIKNFKKESSKP